MRSAAVCASRAALFGERAVDSRQGFKRYACFFRGSHHACNTLINRPMDSRWNTQHADVVMSQFQQMSHREGAAALVVAIDGVGVGLMSKHNTR